jgi:hypothetical protein
MRHHTTAAALVAGVAMCLWCAGCCFPPAGGTDPNSIGKPNPNQPSDSNTPNASDPPFVGRPASFDLELQQGTRTLFTAHVVADANDPAAADDESYYYRLVDSYAYLPGPTNASVYLHVSIASPNEVLSNFAFSIRTAKQTDFRKMANNPLFILSPADTVTLVARNLRFEYNGHPRNVSVFHYPYGELAAGASMLYYGEYTSAYYALPGAIPFDLGPGNKTLQVPQSVFMDHDPNYWFEEGSGVSPSVTWKDMASPSPDAANCYPAMTTDGASTCESGDVFELSVCAVVWLVSPTARTSAP